MKASPDVVILMGVHNGAATLPTQLQSFSEQSHPHWQLLAGDDKSTDQSRTLLEAFGRAHRVTCLDSPGQGAAANFLYLAREAGRRCPESWIAFSDQDDQWLPDKLERGIAALTLLGSESPALYCSRTWITDEDLQGRRLSAPRPRAPGFANALVQNIAAGNTILLNGAASKLVAAAAAEPDEVVVHDWWVYQLVTGVGGQVVHDDEPTLLYRQHHANQIGANDHIRARMRRIAMIFSGTYREWNKTNIAALHASGHRLSPENRAMLKAFSSARQTFFWSRLRRFSRLGLYRQSRISNLALWLAVLLGRV